MIFKKRGVIVLNRSQMALLIIRLLLGILFVYHGIFKIVVFTFAGTAKYFESLGYPGFLAYPEIFVEIIGGLLLLLGIKTRWVSLLLVVMMLFALPAHWPQGFIFTNNGIEVPFTFAILLLALAIDNSKGFRLEN
jgi:putative oxidoreductase